MALRFAFLVAAAPALAATATTTMSVGVTVLPEDPPVMRHDRPSFASRELPNQSLCSNKAGADFDGHGSSAGSSCAAAKETPSRDEAGSHRD